MFSFVERSRLSMHESTLRQAMADAHEATGLYALSMYGAGGSLGAAAGSHPGASLREIVADVPPYALRAADGMLLQMANQSFKRRDMPAYHAFTIVAGIVLSRVVEVAKPKFAERATLYRAAAFDFGGPLFDIGLKLCTDPAVPRPPAELGVAS